METRSGRGAAGQEALNGAHKDIERRAGVPLAKVGSAKRPTKQSMQKPLIALSHKPMHE